MKYDGRKVIGLIIVIELVGILLFAYDLYSRFQPVRSLKRPETEEVTQTLTARLGEIKEQVDIVISPPKSSQEEIEAVLEEARMEIDESFPGENESLDNVTEAVCVRDSYVDGNVSAAWSFSNPEVVSSNGRIMYDAIQENEMITARVELEYQDQKEDYEFMFTVRLPSAETATGAEYYIEKAVEEADEKTAQDEEINLPDELQGIKLSFFGTMEPRGLVLCGLGLIFLLMRPFLEAELAKEEEKKRQQVLASDYPKIVSQLSLFISSGISTRNAIKQMVIDHEKRADDTAGAGGYEELKIWCKEIEAGKSEIKAFQDLGIRSGNPEYKKLALIMVQNLKKGTKNLAVKLEQEELSAFENRKARARMLGEEASTKLLLPMLGLLGIILAILMTPAMMQMNI